MAIKPPQAKSAVKPAASAPKAAPPAPPAKTPAPAVKPAPAAAKPAPSTPKPAAAPATSAAKPGATKPAPAAPKAAPPSPAAVKSDPGIEARLAALEASNAELKSTQEEQANHIIRLTNNLAIYTAGYTNPDAWDLSDAEGPIFSPDNADLASLQRFCWQYSDSVDINGDEKVLKKAAKALKDKGLSLSERSSTEPGGETAESEEEAAPEEEEVEETSMGVDDVDNAPIEQIQEEAAKYGIDVALYAKKPMALKLLLKKNIAEAAARQESESEETEEAETEEAEYAVGDAILVYTPNVEDEEAGAQPELSQPGIKATIAAIAEDSDGDRQYTVKFGKKELKAAQEAFEAMEGALDPKTGVIEGLYENWITRPE